MLPNFLVVWAAKSGTTSLYYYLKEHPDVYLSEENKEFRFFSNLRDIRWIYSSFFQSSIVESLEEYKQYFNDAKNEKAIWEISPDYLFYYQETVKNIKKYLWDEVKIIIILRNPIDRAFSNYVHIIANWYENRTFEEILALEEERYKDNWFFLFFPRLVWLYYKQVKHYLDNFKNVKVYLYDDFKKDNFSIVRDIYKFLWVDHNFTPKISRKRVSIWLPKDILLSQFLEHLYEPHFLLDYKLFTLNLIVNNNNFVEKLNKMIFANFYSLKENNIINFDDKTLKETLKRFVINSILDDEQIDENIINMKKFNSITVEMSQETRKKLIEFYRKDVLNLQDLLKVDLSNWLK